MYVSTLPMQLIAFFFAYSSNLPWYINGHYSDTNYSAIVEYRNMTNTHTHTHKECGNSPQDMILNKEILIHALQYFYYNIIIINLNILLPS